MRGHWRCSLVLVLGLLAGPASAQGDMPLEEEVCVLDLELVPDDSLLVTLDLSVPQRFVDYPIVQVIDDRGRIIGNPDGNVLHFGLSGGRTRMKLPIAPDVRVLGGERTYRVRITNGLDLTTVVAPFPGPCVDESGHVPWMEKVAWTAFVRNGELILYQIPARGASIQLVDAGGNLRKRWDHPATANARFPLPTLEAGSYWLVMDTGQGGALRQVLVR